MSLIKYQVFNYNDKYFLGIIPNKHVSEFYQFGTQNSEIYQGKRKAL